MPYTKGLRERFSKTCRSIGIQVHFKDCRIISNLLVAPKDKDSTTQRSGVNYRFKCSQVDCEQEYLGESGRTFGDSLREHLRAPSPIYQHNIYGMRSNHLPSYWPPLSTCGTHRGTQFSVTLVSMVLPQGMQTHPHLPLAILALFCNTWCHLG